MIGGSETSEALAVVAPIVGGAVGRAARAAVGQSVGGSNGAIIGAGAGGAAGAAIGKSADANACAAAHAGQEKSLYCQLAGQKPAQTPDASTKTPLTRSRPHSAASWQAICASVPRCAA